MICWYFIIITFCGFCLFAGSFINGIAEGPVDEALGGLQAMRLYVHSNSEAWAVLSEVSDHFCVLYLQ